MTRPLTIRCSDCGEAVPVKPLGCLPARCPGCALVRKADNSQARRSASDAARKARNQAIGRDAGTLRAETELRRANQALRPCLRCGQPVGAGSERYATGRDYCPPCGRTARAMKFGRMHADPRLKAR